MKVLVADSCLCWLTTLKYLENKYGHNIQIDYLADNEMNPFWLKTKIEIQNIVKDRLHYMQKNNYNFLLIPCNTASNAIDEIKETLVTKYKIQIFTMVDAFKELISHLEQNLNDLIMLIWTKFTIESKLYERLLNDKWYINIVPIIWTNIEKIVASWTFTDKNLLNEAISLDFSYQKMSFDWTKSIILACSCFYFVKENIKSFITNNSTAWIVFQDPIWSLVELFISKLNIIKDNSFKNTNASKLFYTNYNKRDFLQNVNLFLKTLNLSKIIESPILLNLRKNGK